MALTYYLVRPQMNTDQVRIDSHIHLFDTRRVQGVPYPKKDNAVLYQPALPGRYRALAEPLGVTGAIAVEASPWVEDNLWLLETAATDRFIVGVVGNLEPEKPDFRETVDRYAKHPLFKGIRYGNLWGRSLRKAVETQAFLEGVKHLAEMGLSLDTANPDAELLEAVVRLTDKVPELRIVVDHLPNAFAAVRGQAVLRELASRKQVYVKVSEVVRGGRADVAVLDEIWGLFGDDRLLFGSDWPNWDLEASLEESVRAMREYLNLKGQAAALKFFARNAQAAYRL